MSKFCREPVALLPESRRQSTAGTRANVPLGEDVRVGGITRCAACDRPVRAGWVPSAELMPAGRTEGGLAVSGEGRVAELRLVVTAADHQSALRFYRDVLGLREQESYDANGGHVTIL